MPLRIIQPENHLMALSVLGLVCLAMSASSALAEEPATPTGVLTLGNGDSVPGHFVPSEEAEIVRWQGRDFVRPFEFRGSELSTVQFPTVDPPPRPQGNFALEMESGDFLTGDIENWTEEAVTFQSQHFGQLSLKSNAIRRLFRIEGNPTLTFPGLAGLNDNWKIIEGEWKTEGAQIHSSVSGSVLGARLEVPTKVCVELELSWKSQPNFVVAIGVDPLARKDRRQDGYRFETWGNTLAVVREAHEVADVEAVAKLVPETKSIHVQCFLDQEQGTMNIFSPEGKSIADIEVKPAKEFQLDKDNQGLRFIVRQGDLRIDRLRISQWDGRLPSALEPGKFSLHLTDGENATGEVLAFDPEKKSFQVQINDEERTVLLGDLLGMETLPSLNAGPNLSAMVLQDSTRVSGMVESINGTHVTLASPEIAAPIQVSLANLRAFASLQSKQEAGESQKSGLGKLRLDEHTLTGTLVNAEETDTDSCFSWQPVGSRTSSPLKWGTPGEVIYREAPKPESEEQRQAQERAAVVRRQQGQEFFQLLLKERQNPTVRRPATKETQTHSLHLRSGDVIPCHVVRISEEGVQIDSTVAEKDLIPHSFVKAIELVKTKEPPDLKEAKKQRLLTVPRLMKSSPPTHLLCAQTGDFLRCRLLEMTAEIIRVELQLEEIEIPTSRVAQVIWFHPEEMDANDETGEAPKSSEEPVVPAEEAAVGEADGFEEAVLDDGGLVALQEVVDEVLKEPAPEATPPKEEAGDAVAGGLEFQRLAQIIESDGDRVTFDPQRVEDGTIYGQSDVLGTVQFTVAQIDRLLFGRQIALATGELPYHQWKLTPAKEPLVASEDGMSTPDVGNLSPLVGQDAPDFRLDLVDGKTFELSKQRGKIIVLDFWASWCGPCMQTMPLVEEAMAEFDPEQVQLISVNLEETAQQVKSVLDRHQLDLTVALDIDGTTARKYQANAIPQLVIVDKNGKIARLYVGGGSGVVEQLRQALLDLLGADS